MWVYRVISRCWGDFAMSGSRPHGMCVSFLFGVLFRSRPERNNVHFYFIFTYISLFIYIFIFGNFGGAHSVVFTLLALIFYIIFIYLILHILY